MENFICNQYGERLAMLNTKNVKICVRITKLKATKNEICLHFLSYLPNICRNLNFYPKVCSNMPKVKWVMSYSFCSKFHTLSNSAKISKIG